MIFAALCLQVAPSLAAPIPVAIPTQDRARPTAIRADVIWLGDGRVIEKGVVLIAQGRITDVGTNVDVPDGVGTIEHKGTLTAGLVSLHGYSGAPREMSDETRAALPDAKVANAFDSEHYDFADARAAGITTLVLTPQIWGVAPGVSAVVKSSALKVLSDEAQLSLIFTAEGLTTYREPTSIPGAMLMMEQLFKEPSGAVERALAGKLPCLFETSVRPDVGRAIEFAKRHKLKGAIHGAVLAGELAEEIRDAKLDVIVPALGVGTERRVLKAVLNLHKTGVRIGFGLDSPFNNPAALRLSAALCVREGLDTKAAWNALTSDAARIAGVSERVGRIEAGLDADIVLWSGDPLDLGSRIVAVYVDGVQVAGGDR